MCRGSHYLYDVPAIGRRPNQENKEHEEEQGCIGENADVDVFEDCREEGRDWRNAEDMDWKADEEHLKNCSAEVDKRRNSRLDSFKDSSSTDPLDAPFSSKISTLMAPPLLPASATRNIGMKPRRKWREQADTELDGLVDTRKLILRYINKVRPNLPQKIISKLRKIGAAQVRGIVSGNSQSGKLSQLSEAMGVNKGILAEFLFLQSTADYPYQAYDTTHGGQLDGEGSYPNFDRLDGEIGPEGDLSA